MQILVTSGEFSIILMNNYDICQLEVHDVEVCLVYYLSTSPRQVVKVHLTSIYIFFCLNKSFIILLLFCFLCVIFPAFFSPARTV